MSEDLTSHPWLNNETERSLRVRNIFHKSMKSLSSSKHIKIYESRRIVKTSIKKVKRQYEENITGEVKYRVSQKNVLTLRMTRKPLFMNIE